MNARALIPVAALFCAVPAFATDEVAQLPKYEKPASAKLSGTLDSVGSDTMNNLMTYWAEGFKRHFPDVKLQVEGKGSSTAPKALIGATAHFGPMSRAMKQEEIDEFEKKFGYKPTEIKTALDALAVFVHKDNPLESLSMEQVDAIFSITRNYGHADITTWGQLGLEGDWAKKPLSLFGRNSASGTYGFFKENALSKGDFKNEVKEQPGSSSVVQGVAEDRFAIGYSGIGYRTPNVRALPLAAKAGKKAYAADLENVVNGDYPLGRFLFVYVNKAPGKPLDPMVREYLRFVLSLEGQEIVEKDGYLPLPAEVVEEELAKLD
jgi:phosphate transport system substrate-binding protein